jgi:hypothetical protein
MALSNYTEIKASVEAWLNREGFTEITNQTEDFLLLAHKRIIREIRAPWMELSTTQAVSDTTGEGSLPADFLDVKTLIYTDTSESVTYGLIRSPRYVVESKQEATGGSKFYEINNGTVFVGPRPAAADTFILVYYQEPTAISSGTATNAISDQAPELYLYGAMIEAAIFMKDSDAATVYKQEFQEAKSRIEQFSVQHEASGDAMTAELRSPTAKPM